MGHKSLKARLGLSVFAVAILVPLGSAVNHLAKSSVEKTKSRNLRVDGTPIPPLPPPTGTLVADGTPIPPLPPPTGMLDGFETLVADGTPIPPLPPPTGVEGFVSFVG